VLIFTDKEILLANRHRVFIIFWQRLWTEGNWIY